MLARPPETRVSPQPLPPRRHRFVVLSVFALAAVLALGAPARAAELTLAEASLVQTMNDVRAEHKRRPLRVDPALHRAARSHSRDMLRRDYFAHGNLGVRVTAFRVRGPVVGENLAFGVGPGADAWAVVQAWLASPHHRANLLRPGFRRVGVAALVGRFGAQPRVRLITADFAGV